MDGKEKVIRQAEALGLNIESDEDLSVLEELCIENDVELFIPQIEDRLGRFAKFEEVIYQRLDSMNDKLEDMKILQNLVEEHSCSDWDRDMLAFGTGLMFR